MSENRQYIPFYGCMISLKYPQFEAAVRRTAPSLGMELIDIEGFTCCPDPIYFKSSDKMNWLTVAARNLCLAEKRGLDLITLCSGCTATLLETRHLLSSDAGLRSRVNKRLAKIGMTFKGSSRVRHIVTVLRDDVGFERIARTVSRPLENIRVAIHYGCHLLKPSRIMQVDDPDSPTILEQLVNLTGAEAIEHEEKLLCCGKACENPDIPPHMTFDVMRSVDKLNVDCMCLICPTCFDEYDLGQLKLSRLFNTKIEIPVLYYFQLLGLAQGIPPEKLGLSRHKIKATELVEKIGALAAVS